LLPVKERGVSDGADAQTATIVSQFCAKRITFGAVETQKSQLDQFLRPKLQIQFREKCGRQSTFAQFEHRFEVLAEAAQMLLLCAGQ